MSSPEVPSLAGVFAQMEGTRVGAGQIHRRMAVSASADVVAYLNTESGLRGVRFEFSNQVAVVSGIDKVRGLSVVLASSLTGQTIAVEQARPGDGQLFTVVIESILRSFSEFPQGEAKATADKLVRWRAFFSRASEGLNREQQLGLFGELFILREISRSSGDPSIAVAFWEGPHSAVHDFSQADWALEVKATAALGSGTATITNERQLDPGTLESLYLAFLAFDVRPNGAGVTLPQIVGRVRRELAARPSAADHFEDLLIEAGYSDAHSGLYHSHYTITRQDAFLISEDFPSIREPQLPQAVSRVRYYLNVDLCKEWAVSFAEMIDSLGERHDSTI